MSNIFIHPSTHLIETNISSASSQAGLRLGQPVASLVSGRLKLNAAGQPTAAVSLNFRLASPGNPVGYSPDESGVGNGAGLLWKNQSDGSSAWRGYTDSRFFTRQVPWRSAVCYSTGTPLQLPGGDLLVPRVTASTIEIESIDSTYSATALSTISDSYAGVAAGTSCRISDQAILPSGRIVLLYLTNTTQAGKYVYKTVFSDDYGVTWTTMASIAQVSTNLYTQVNLVCIGETLFAVVSDDGTNGGEVWISNDQGFSFATTGSDSSWKNVRACVSGQTGIVASLNASSTTLVVKVTRFGSNGILGDVSLTEVGNDDSSAVGLVTRDDGAVFCYVQGNTATDDNIYCQVSVDAGSTWQTVTSTGLVFGDNSGSSVRWFSLDFGVWKGSIVCSARRSGATQQHWLEWGGWDRVGEYQTSATYQRTYTPTALPNSVGWTKTDTGTGITAAIGNDLELTSSLAGNSAYSAPTTWWDNAAQRDYRLRFTVQIVSGGSTVNNAAVVSWQQSDGVNAQGNLLRFASTGYVILDQAGNNLATITTDMTLWHEFLIVIRYDRTANNGAVRVLRRALYGPSSGAWTEDLTLTSFAESADVNTFFRFGGNSILSACAWNIGNFQLARGDGSLSSQANPGDLPGRPLGGETAFYVDQDVFVSGYSLRGLKADTWALDSTYSYLKENIWRNQRPSCQWRSSADNTSTNIVFDAGANNVFRGQIAALFGINFRTATLQFNSTDSWGAPSATLSLDGTIVSGAVSATKGKGYIGFTITSGFTMVPHMFKSSEGQRFFVDVGGTSYEISDNSDTLLYVDGVDFSAAAGTVYVYSDRLAADYGSVIGYRFMRLLIGAQQTADDDYRVGYLLWNEQHSISTLYDRGFVDEWQENLVVTESDAGQRFVAARGPKRRRLAVRWNNLNRLLTSYEEKNLHFFSSLRGEAFAHWRNTNDPSAVTLYALDNQSLARENTLGEGADALTSRGQLTFIEVI